MNQIRDILKKELERRQKNNSAYSLRAFAKYLDVSPAALSQIMSGKRGVSVKRLNFLMDKLGLSPKQQLKVLEIDSSYDRKTVVLKEDEFKLISDWFHYAILSLGELPDNSSDSRWIAKRLNISYKQANEALTRLHRLGIIEIKDGKFRQIGEPLKTTTDIPSSSIRNYHKGILALAQNKIEQVSVDKRDFSSITMAINSKNLKNAKKLTQKYKEQMLELLESGTLNEVYQLSIQLFPLTSGDEE